MERNLNQQVADAKLAFQLIVQRLETAKENLILARVKRPLNEKKIRSCENKIQSLMGECKKIKELNEDLGEQKVIARKQQKNIEVMIHEQKAIGEKLRTESKALLVALKSAQAINLRILQLDGQYFSIKDQTGKAPDRKGSSSGFHSLRALLEICEAEVAGRPRPMFHYAPRALV